MKWFKEVKCGENASEEERKRLLQQTFDEYSRQNPESAEIANSEERQIEIALSQKYKQSQAAKLIKTKTGAKQNLPNSNSQIANHGKPNPNSNIRITSLRNNNISQNLDPCQPDPSPDRTWETLEQKRHENCLQNEEPLSNKKKRQSILLAPFFLTKDLDLGTLSEFMDDLDGKEKFAQAEHIFLQRSKNLHKIVIIDPNLR